MAATPVVVSSALRCHALRLKPGDKFKPSVRKALSNLGLRAAFIVSCVGSVEEVTLRYASDVSGQCKTETKHERLEILSLTGTLSGNERGHLHASFGDVRGNVIDGHVVDMTVYTTAEVIIGELTEAAFARNPDPNTRCEELVVAPR